VRLCNAILFKQAAIRENKMTPFKAQEIVIQEDPEVCDTFDSHHALLHIFASSFIASLVDADLAIRYQHDCHVHGQAETIQKYLPSPLSMPEVTTSVSVEEMCQRCTNPECILFSHEEHGAANRKLIMSEIGSNINHALMAFSFMHRVPGDVDDSMAAIYLAGTSCPDYIKDMRHFVDYPLAIPDTVTEIMLIVTDEFRDACRADCDPRSEPEKHCSQYDFVLRKFLKDYYNKPVTIVGGANAEKYEQKFRVPDTVVQFLKFKNSRYFVCPVGEQCLFPALTSRHFVNLLGGESQISPWFKGWRNVATIPIQFDKAYCTKLRGRHGQWIQDTENAESYQYDSPLGHYFGSVQRNHEASDEVPYHPTSTYKWNEPYFPVCQFNLLTKAEMCQTLSALNIQRVLFVGDGLQFNMAQSFWKLMDQKGSIDNNFSGTISCATLAHPLFEIEMEYIRNDQLIENDLPVDMTPWEYSDKQRNCNGFCYPWTDTYRSSSKNTLLLLNTGSHYSLLQDFQLTIHDVFQKLDDIERKNDIVFFRSVAPRHDNCAKYNQPLDSYVDYLKTDPSDGLYNRYVTKFNAHVAHLIENREFYLTSSYTRYFADIKFLDIFPMTVVRPDGHIVKEMDIDCFHYSQPGVVDWWNHLLYNDLVNLVDGKKSQNA